MIHLSPPRLRCGLLLSLCATISPAMASDIAAGALIGIAVGHTVVKLNGENRGAHVAIVPTGNGPLVALVIPVP